MAKLAYEVEHEGAIALFYTVAGQSLQHFRTLASQERQVNIEAVQQVVAEEFRLRLADLKARNNSRKVVYPRQVAMYLCRDLAGASLPEIGRAFGGKHHTTVLHSVDKIEERKETDKELNRLLHRLSDLLR
jgi:chromosomal replication initiator protein